MQLLKDKMFLNIATFFYSRFTQELGGLGSGPVTHNCTVVFLLVYERTSNVLDTIIQE